MGMISRLKSYTGHRIREAALYPAALKPRLAPRIMFFPSSTREGASLLRAYNIAHELSSLDWQTLVVPTQLELVQRRRLMRVFQPDLLFFQQCRHSLNDAAFSFGTPFILDIDDADFVSSHMRDKLARTCREARGVIAGSRFVAEWCRGHNPSTGIVWTGTPFRMQPANDHASRPPIIAWAQASPIGYPAELDFVRRFHECMMQRGARFRLRLYGIDDAAMRENVLRSFADHSNIETLPLMDYEAFLSSLRDVAVGLSPIMPSSPFSRGKSFGKILGYLDARVPVIASREADHELFFTPESGIVTNDLVRWVEAALDLLASPEKRNVMAGIAYENYGRRLSTKAAAMHVDCLLNEWFLDVRKSEHPARRVPAGAAL